MITIVDYGMGNLGSIHNMLKRIGVSSQITGDREEVAKAQKLILPGVGGFNSGISRLEELGLREVLDQKAKIEKIPILGICLGMQLMCNSSEEGSGAGLSWINADVVKFRFPEDDRIHKVPHIGWNQIKATKAHSSLDGSSDNTRFYFVHSYFVQCSDRQDVLATTNYGIQFDSMFSKDNVLGVQFHPEKSHRFGMELLKNFSEM